MHSFSPFLFLNITIMAQVVSHPSDFVVHSSNVDLEFLIITSFNKSFIYIKTTSTCLSSDYVNYNRKSGNEGLNLLCVDSQAQVSFSYQMPSLAAAAASAP